MLFRNIRRSFVFSPLIFTAFTLWERIFHAKRRSKGESTPYRRILTEICCIVRTLMPLFIQVV
jgi:hypothetical protein